MSWILDDADDFDTYLDLVASAPDVEQQPKRLCFLQDMADYSDADDMRPVSGVERIVAAVDHDEARHAAEEKARRAAIAYLIADALMRLTPRQREYVELSFFARKRDCEIQVLWGCTQKVVAYFKHVSLLNLKKVMKSYQQCPKSPSVLP